jgi:hypothetical protein
MRFDDFHAGVVDEDIDLSTKVGNGLADYLCWGGFLFEICFDANAY